MADAPHDHVWRMTVHLDSCHSFESRYACECGAARRIYAERDCQDDPYAAIWMDPDGSETGVEGGCPRCRLLLDGAKPVSSDDTVEAS